MTSELERPVERRHLVLEVNGERHELIAPVHKTLLEVLREDLRLTGTKHGCELGECGTCTVLVAGQPMLSCLLLPAQVGGRPITTIEGLARGAELHPLQQAFAELGAAQCGYCTPGILLGAAALLEANATPTREEIKEALAGNLCRCTGYVKIIEAVELAAVRASAPIPGSGTPSDGGGPPIPGNGAPSDGGGAPIPGNRTPAAGGEAPIPGNRTPAAGGGPPIPGNRPR